MLDILNRQHHLLGTRFLLCILTCVVAYELLLVFVPLDLQVVHHFTIVVDAVMESGLDLRH